jgi:hypothetical protein
MNLYAGKPLWISGGQLKYEVAGRSTDVKQRPAQNKMS